MCDYPTVVMSLGLKVTSTNLMGAVRGLAMHEWGRT